MIGRTEFVNYTTYSVIYTSNCCHGELEKINSKCQQYKETNFNDLNIKMTTMEIICI
jgi:hypothetical protein